MNAGQAGDRFFRRLREVHLALAGKAKAYPAEAPKESLPAHRFETKELKGRIFRLCPAASEKAVCCNLKVLNIVDNCAMACSYCVLQNHYDEAVVAVPTNLKEKLAEVQLNPDKRYRIGTGEYSDSLLWGNKNGLLEDLFDFARANPNAIVELKTKSANIAWLLEHEVPANICCSWSLNPQTIVSHEEHKTASLDRRLAAARALADKGVRVGFHFHPMFYFEGYAAEYRDLIAQVMARFRPEEVLWVSLGCVTMLKGFAQDFRLKFSHSKLLQMETEITPGRENHLCLPGAGEAVCQCPGRPVALARPGVPVPVHGAQADVGRGDGFRLRQHGRIRRCLQRVRVFEAGEEERRLTRLIYFVRPSGSISFCQARMPPVTLKQLS